MARRLAEGGAELIFPALKRSHLDLEKCIEPFRYLRCDQKGEIVLVDGFPLPDKNGRPFAPLAVANIILAELKDAKEEAVETLAVDARGQMLRFWRDDIAEPIRGRCEKLLAQHRDQSGHDKMEDIWREQIETTLIGHREIPSINAGA